MADDKTERRTSTTERRDQMWHQGIRGLLLINGAGTVTLLAFLQTIWTEAEPLVRWVVWGLVPLVLGVVLAAVIPFLRAETSLWWTDPGGRGARMMRLYRRLAAASTICFAIGIGIVIAGLLQNLPNGATGN